MHHIAAFFTLPSPLFLLQCNKSVNINSLLTFINITYYFTFISLTSSVIGPAIKTTAQGNELLITFYLTTPCSLSVGLTITDYTQRSHVIDIKTQVRMGADLLDVIYPGLLKARYVSITYRTVIAVPYQGESSEPAPG